MPELLRPVGGGGRVLLLPAAALRPRAGGRREERPVLRREEVQLRLPLRLQDAQAQGEGVQVSQLVCSGRGKKVAGLNDVLLTTFDLEQI